MSSLDNITLKTLLNATNQDSAATLLGNDAFDEYSVPPSGKTLLSSSPPRQSEKCTFVEVSPPGKSSLDPGLKEKILQRKQQRLQMLAQRQQQLQEQRKELAEKKDQVRKPVIRPPPRTPIQLPAQNVDEDLRYAIPPPSSNKIANSPPRMMETKVEVMEKEHKTPPKEDAPVMLQVSPVKMFKPSPPKSSPRVSPRVSPRTSPKMQKMTLSTQETPVRKSPRLAKKASPAKELPKELQNSPPTQKSTTLEFSPPTKKATSLEFSPPTKKALTLEISPPAKKPKLLEFSPPAKKSTSMELSPPAKKSTTLEISPPAKKPSTLEISPPAKKPTSLELSPPTKKPMTLEISPPAKTQVSLEFSPPRTKPVRPKPQDFTEFDEFAVPPPSKRQLAMTPPRGKPTSPPTSPKPRKATPEPESPAKQISPISSPMMKPTSPPLKKVSQKVASSPMPVPRPERNQKEGIVSDLGPSLSSLTMAQVQSLSISHAQPTPAKEFVRPLHTPLTRVHDTHEVSPASHARYSMRELEEAKRIAVQDITKQLVLVQASVEESENRAKMAEEERAQMEVIVKQFEETMNQLVARTEAQESEIEELKKERKRKEELAIVAKDLKRQLEECVKQFELTRASEQSLRTLNDQLRNENATWETRYDKLKRHAQEKLDLANSEILKMKSGSEKEILALKSKLSRTEVAVKSLEQGLEAKKKENEELTRICDELMAQLDSK